MADLSVSVPYGGGSIRAYSNTNNTSNNNAHDYCWLGGSTTDKNLWMTVRIQEDPDFAIIDVWTQNMRNRSSQGRTLIRSQVYSLGGEAFSQNTNNLSYRSIRVERLNSNTALLKIPYNNDNSTYYVLEVAEDTGIVTSYIFDNTDRYNQGGMYNYYQDSYSTPRGYQSFMKNVEDNVMITYEQRSSNGGGLNQKVWDPSAKTLSQTTVATDNKNYTAIRNFESNRQVVGYSGTAYTIDPRFGTSSNSNGGFINATEGRDGKWYFRECNNRSSNYANVRSPNAFAFVYIPTSQGGDLATSGYSQSWGIAGGFNGSNQYGLVESSTGPGSFGVFLPVNSEQIQAGHSYGSTVESQRGQFPQFYVKSYIECGYKKMIVHTEGTQNTEMFYSASDTSLSDNGRAVDAEWLDSNHFFVNTVNNANSSNFVNNSQNSILLQQYVDENYTTQIDLQTVSPYCNFPNNQGARWFKLDDYTVYSNAFRSPVGFWAPE